MIIETPAIVVDTSEKPISQVIDFIEALSNNLHIKDRPKISPSEHERAILSSIGKRNTKNNKYKIAIAS